MAFLTAPRHRRCFTWSPLWRVARWLAIGFCLLAVRGFAQTAAAPTEYQIKAVFLFNFAQFVEWPPAAFADATSPLVIGVLGEDPFGAHLDDAVRNEKVRGRALVVQRFRRAADVTPCHILFVSSSENTRMEQTLAGFARRPVLTVGESATFMQGGGMIRFTRDNNRVRLQINPEAAKTAGLTISSKLLRPAEIVSTPKE